MESVHSAIAGGSKRSPLRGRDRSGPVRSPPLPCPQRRGLCGQARCQKSGECRARNAPRCCPRAPPTPLRPPPPCTSSPEGARDAGIGGPRKACRHANGRLKRHPRDCSAHPAAQVRVALTSAEAASGRSRGEMAIGACRPPPPPRTARVAENAALTAPPTAFALLGTLLSVVICGTRRPCPPLRRGTFDGARECLPGVAPLMWSQVGTLS